jgi:CRP-like cAMP-binding protein
MADTIDDEVALLRTVPFFETMEPAKLKLLAYVSERLEFEDKDVIFEEGSSGDDVYFILAGKADIVREMNGTPVFVAQLDRHALFGEMSVFCSLPRTAGVRASGHLAVLRIPGEAFLALIREQPALAMRVIRELALRLARTTHNLTIAETATD